MTTVVLLVLGLIWAAVLIVPLVRHRRSGDSGDPIGTFRRQINVLERAAPVTVRAANRLRVPTTRATAIPPYRPPAMVRQQARLAPGPARRPTAAPSAAIYRRRQMQKRRRDILFALMAGLLASLVLAMIPGLRPMIYLQVTFDILFAGYILLLVRLRNAAAAPARRDLRTLAVLPTRSAPEQPAPDPARRVYREVEGYVAPPTAPALLMRQDARQHWAS